jgi:hypothetical protein
MHDALAIVWIADGELHCESLSVLYERGSCSAADRNPCAPGIRIQAVAICTVSARSARHIGGN